MITPARRKARSRLHISAIAATVVVVAAGGLALWQHWTPDLAPASIDKMALLLPNKPSIGRTSKPSSRRGPISPSANMPGRSRLKRSKSSIYIYISMRFA